MDDTGFKVPGKAHRKGFTLFDLHRMFPDQESAQKWLRAIV